LKTHFSLVRSAIPAASAKSGTAFQRTSANALPLVGALLLIFSCLAAAADSAPNDPVLRALREEMDRSKSQLKLENVAAPYYIEYRVTELDQFDASAVFGALRNQQHIRARLLRV
jgi:hypothetical protein